MTARNTTALYAAVAIGSAIGGSARWLISTITQAQLGSGFAWDLLFVNISGSFLIGFYAALAGPDGRLFAGPRQRHFVMTGVLGGYTTFSIFSLESLRLVESGRYGTAGLFVGVSVIGWLAAAWGGHAVATNINRLRRT